ncbi:hypothetical protein [Nocardioides sp. Soil774]|uniref:hypothetical protein n=1 Tax=Nocardioides sp. Soil774 TaxID=1736408 RepID=UPI0012FC16C1|nr:hypothetical protein [Nocardioides sp. Soil774]
MREKKPSWLIVGLVAFVLSYNCITAWREASDPEVFAVFYLGLAAFVGTYSVLDGQADQPSPWMAAGLILALFTTFGAATSVLLHLSRTRIARLSTARRRGGVVIIGSSAEADAIARSLDGEARASLVRIHEDGPASGRGSMLLQNWQDIGDDPLAEKLVRAATSVVVAGSSDTVSARLAAAARPLMRQSRPFQLVRSSDLARALRPSVLTTLPEAEGFHPADNIGQLVAAALVAHGRDRKVPVLVSFVACGVSPLVTTIQMWLANTSSATNLIKGQPSFAFVPTEAEAEVCVVAGVPERVAAEVARQSSERAVVAAVAADLLGSVALPQASRLHKLKEWSPGSPLVRGDVLVVDPDADGLDHRVVTDGLDVQWGRAFDDAYTSLYVAAHPGTSGSAWSVGSLGRNEQSSIAAAKYMLAVLGEHGFELRSGTGLGWVDGPPSPEVIDRMARMEHDEWWKRRMWTDPEGVERRVSLRLQSDGTWHDGPHCREFEELDPSTRDYNHDVIAKVYPALAAMFGYGIRRVQPTTGS